MASEEVKALKRTRQFLRDLYAGPRMPTIEMRDRAFSCLKHLPWDVTIDEKWSDEVCMRCGENHEFCKCKEAV